MDEYRPARDVNKQAESPSVLGQINKAAQAFVQRAMSILSSGMSSKVLPQPESFKQQDTASAENPLLSINQSELQKAKDFVVPFPEDESIESGPFSSNPEFEGAQGGIVVAGQEEKPEIFENI